MDHKQITRQNSKKFLKDAIGEYFLSADFEGCDDKQIADEFTEDLIIILHELIDQPAREVRCYSRVLLNIRQSEKS